MLTPNPTSPLVSRNMRCFYAGFMEQKLRIREFRYIPRAKMETLGESDTKAQVMTTSQLSCTGEVMAFSQLAIKDQGVRQVPYLQWKWGLE